MATKMLFARVLAGAAAVMMGMGAVTPAKAADAVTVTIDSFGDVILMSLVREYQDAHPGVTIQVKKNNLADLNGTGLTTGCLTGKTADITAIEVAYAGYWRTKPQCFTDLRTLKTTDGKKSATEIKADYLSWRWSQGVATNKLVFGIPTDVGGLQVAYRTDLFKKAGLPTDRVKVGKLWATWDGYIATGKKYMKTISAANKKKNVAFMDNAGAIYAAVVNQGTQKYYDEAGNLVYKQNKQVKKAFDETIKGLNANIGSKIGQFTSGWYTGLGTGTFATILAPAWMMEYIKSYAGATKGKWDIAAMPGGGGNQGGSLLTIPAAAKNKQAAWDFLQWYLAPDQQEKVFTRFGLFPSTPALYKKSSIKDFKDPFFSNAPVGAIYATGVQKLKPIPLGPKDQAIDNVIGAALSRVANKKQSAAKAWAQAMTEAAKIK